MVDRLLLLAAVNMFTPPSTQGVAQRLAVSKYEAETALTEAERVHLVSKEQRARPPADPAGMNRHRWRLSEQGRVEMNRLLRAH